MDLLKPEDLVRDSLVIAIGYGLENEGGQRKAERPLKFTRLNMYMLEGSNLNETITFSDRYTKTCPGMSL